jgi:hypothetical protein
MEGIGVDNAFIFQLRGSKNDNFGTAFAIHEDDSGTYLISCNHVVEDLEDLEELYISPDIKVEVIATDEVKDGFDVVLLKTSHRLNVTIYPLNPDVNSKNSFVCVGFHANGAKQKIVESIFGKLNQKGNIESSKFKIRIPAFSFDVFNDSTKFEKGYSGSPILDKVRKCIVGIANLKTIQGNQGSVISIRALEQLDSELYKKILNQNGNGEIVEIEDFSIRNLLPNELQRVIFDPRYTQYYSHFYITRDRNTENKIVKLIDNCRNIWSFGKSGVGKTTMSHRHKIHSDVDFHYYYASSQIKLKNATEIFEDIMSSLTDSESGTLENQNVIKRIAIALNNMYQGRKVVFLMDELNHLTESVFTEFVSMTVALSQEYANLNDSNEKIIFWVSTLDDPLKVCINPSKARESFSFLELLTWEKTDIETLLGLISTALGFNFNDEEKKYCLKKIKNPRDLKTCLQIYLDDNERGLIDIVDENKTLDR